MTTFDRRAWGWMFFDWASQPYFTLLLTFIFAPYFASAVMSDAALAQQYWGWMLAAAGIVVALGAPILGACVDAGGHRTKWILGCSVLYVCGAGALWFATPDSMHVAWILLAFGLGLIGTEFAITFTNAMLPRLGPTDQIGMISGAGWAFGYCGGLVALIFTLLFLAENAAGVTLLGSRPILGLDPSSREGTRFVGPFAAIWFALFMIPFFVWTRGTDPASPPSAKVGTALRGLSSTIRNLPKNRNLFAYLGSSMFYRDGLNGIFAFGGIYAAGILGWSIVQIGIFGIAGIIAGMVAAWFGGIADARFGPRPVITVCIALLIITCSAMITTSRDMVLLLPVADDSRLPDIALYVFGGLIGAAGGALQASSRTMMVRLADPQRMNEAFGLYALAGKATAFLAPASIAIATSVTGDQRLGVSPLIALFVIALLLLALVRPKIVGDDA